MKLDLSILDKLIDDEVAFAIYRLPASEDIRLIIQDDCNVYKTADLTDLTDKIGFVLSPFEATDHSPIVLIRPDIQLDSFSDIEQFAKNYVSKGKHNPKKDNLEQSTTKEEYELMFDAFQQELSAGKFKKLVLSRKRIISLGGQFSPGKAYAKALSQNSNTFLFLAHTALTGSWLGSTPEMFLTQRNDTFNTVALAGTQSIGEMQDVQHLQWSQKNIREQQFVSDYMSQQLSSHDLNYTASETYTIRVGHIAHLKTDFCFQKNDKVNVGEIISMIHPSPAVCGLPKDSAFDFIVKNENHSRKYYSGFVGNLSMNNQTDLYVNLRCMQIAGNSVVLYAGGGILPSSDVDEEWTETEDKMEAMLQLVDVQ